MEKGRKKGLALGLGMILALSCAGNSFAAEEEAEALPAVGETMHGFTMESAEYSSLLDADILSFTHEYSGAQLVYVKNSDPEKAFSITFRTPYVDETDTNHVFEHAILASSEKYPSKDIFYDLSNKGYMTFVNAYTYSGMTIYPIASLSEDQLLKGMDIYMSCMEAPTILKDKNFFLREAVRLELESPEEEIGINGTVFAEDTGYMTSMEDVSYDHTLDTLFPGETASNMNGKAEYHYQDLTYEHTLETYERCYHYDNSLICLYGDLDIDRFLEFLDTEYLSKQERYGTDLSEWKDPLTEAGYEEAVLPVPAYEGDEVENSGTITYAIDMEDASDRELITWDVLTTLLNMNSSPMNQRLIEKDIQNPVYASIDTYCAKPILQFQMYYANEDQMQELKELVQETLQEVAEDGLAPEMMDAVLKQQKLSSVMLLDSDNAGVNIAPVIANDWVRTGRTDYYQQFDKVLSELAADTEQTEIRSAANAILEPRRSALVASIPSPGLAEEHDAELEQYLTDLKASMTPEEIDQMVEDTASFNEWNESEIPNNDFLIDPEILPDPEKLDTYTVSEKDGVTLYTGTVDSETAGRYRVYFDLTGMEREDIEYLMLYLSMIQETGTDRYSAGEIELLMAEYLYDFKTSLVYPNEVSGDHHRPMLMVEWAGLTEDFEKGLDLVMNLLTGTDLTQHDMIEYLLWRDSEGWDMSRQDGADIAEMAAISGAGLNADTNAFVLDADGQDVYWLVSDIVADLMEDESYPQTLQERFESVRSMAFTNCHPVFMSVTGSEESAQVADTAVSVLSALPEKEKTDPAYELPVPAKRTAICIEASQNYTSMYGDFLSDPEFKGSYLPFMAAANDKYTIPMMRFRLGAYSAGSGIGINGCVLYNYTYVDPNVKKTMDVLTSLPENLKELSLTEEEMDGYILNTYAIVTYPRGFWGGLMNQMSLDFLGLDISRRAEMIDDIRNTTVDLLPEAADHIAKVMDTATLATVGNEAMIRADADAFDEVITYRSLEQE